ncbi:MAG TPA: capsule assembly Wzi family protein [Bryobacteraceae bacterium]|nr:capsule assembly Wzi family protein [Bryobacteraceae bacterium]
MNSAIAAGPVYVPLDSWVYPALRRLAALGYVPDADVLVLPWTRQQCLTLIEEAEDIASRRSRKLLAGAANSEALGIVAALRAEFPPAEQARQMARIESVYTRLTEISGTPLRDSYHFGQTIIDDYGRPYSEGANTVTGVAASGLWNRFSGYLRAEYQQSPVLAPYSARVQNFIAQADGIPAGSNIHPSATGRLDPLEMYIGAELGKFDVTIGKQSFWWGPGQDSAFHFSDNAEPIYALRISQNTPILLPGPFRLLGRIRTYFVLGRLSGHDFPPEPWINAQKITLQLTENLELGFARSAIFGGVGHPLTVDSFLRSFFSTSSTGGTAFGSRNDPGDRRSGFDFRWRLPMLRRYVTLYSDSLADDEPSPLASPRRSAWGPGISIAQIPSLPNVELQFETYSTWLYARDEGGRFIYWNDQYHDAYTNDKLVLGSWVGRDSRAYVASASYSVSPRNQITATYRQVKSSGAFLPGGGTQTDIGLRVQWQLRPDLSMDTFAQGERYDIPILGAPRKNLAAGLQFTFCPTNWIVRR